MPQVRDPQGLSPGDIVALRYRIVSFLGEGGMGAVYQAEHLHMQKPVALKVLHPQFVGHTGVLARFEREAIAAGKISHPNVAAATDFGKLPDGSFFLVLELVTGRSLRKDLEKSAPFSAEHAVKILRGILAGVGAAHAKNIVHRDLKPENIMLVDHLGDPDFVKVLDFGIAKLESGHAEPPSGVQLLTRRGEVFGTPDYMAPEQALGEGADARADLYSLGVMFYEMLSGVRPFDDENPISLLAKQISSPVPKMNERVPGSNVPAELEQIALRLLEKQPPDRFASVHELAAALTAWETRVSAERAAPLTSAVRKQLSFWRERGLTGFAPRVRAWSRRWTPFENRLQPFGERATQALVRVSPFAGRVPRVLRAQLAGAQRLWRSLPRWAQAINGLTLLLLLLILVWPKHLQKPAPSPGMGTPQLSKTEQASAEELQKASVLGETALLQLAERFPKDLNISRELLQVYLRSAQNAKALRAAKTWIERDVTALQDVWVEKAIVAGLSEPELAEQAFALVEGPLGARGVDLLLELENSRVSTASPGTAGNSANPTSTESLRARARQALAKPEVRAHASAEAALYLEFRQAKTCEAKRDLLPRVARDGDARVLAGLRALRNQRGCGFLSVRDCWSCLRRDNALGDAITAVEAKGRSEPRK